MAFEKITRKHTFIAGASAATVFLGGAYFASQSGEGDPIQTITCDRDKKVEFSDKSPVAVMINYAIEGKSGSKTPYKGIVRLAISKGDIQVDAARKLSKAQMAQPLAAPLEPGLHHDPIKPNKHMEDNWYVGKDVVVPLATNVQKVGELTVSVAFNGNDADRAGARMMVNCTDPVVALG